MLGHGILRIAAQMLRRLPLRAPRHLMPFPGPHIGGPVPLPIPAILGGPGLGAPLGGAILPPPIIGGGGPMAGAVIAPVIIPVVAAAVVAPIVAPGALPGGFGAGAGAAGG
jgi:hypothetical protein